MPQILRVCRARRSGARHQKGTTAARGALSGTKQRRWSCAPPVVPTIGKTLHRIRCENVPDRVQESASMAYGNWPQSAAATASREAGSSGSNLATSVVATPGACAPW